MATMNISILSVFPELYAPFLNTSLIKRAQENNAVSFDTASFFSYVSPKQRIDAPSFGTGAGMLIKPEVVEKAVADLEAKHGPALRVFFSPHGKKLDQRLLASLAERAREIGHLMLLPARYEGMDARVEDEFAHEVVSVGDFVLMGGDIPAMMLIEGLMRFIPGVVGKQESVEHDSFSGPFVDYPEYTHPVEWRGRVVPEIVRSGNHGAVQAWRTQQAAKRSVHAHMDWVRHSPLTVAQRELVKKNIPNHYVALAHADVMIGSDRAIGTTSVTSMDLHDIARSSRTYGVEQFFVVTPLKDQQRVVQTLLNFWASDVGIAYNSHRHESVMRVMLKDTMEQVIEAIERKEGVKPLVIATSAIADGAGERLITFHEQEKVWAHGRPVLIVLGTGQGLNPAFIERCDYQLMPLYGLTDFNHLSVRSAAAIIVDRWLGINPRVKN